MYYEAALVPTIALLVFAAAYASEIYDYLGAWIPIGTSNPFIAMPTWSYVLLFVTIILGPPLLRYVLVRERLRYRIS
jgi:hypothetical protein